MCTLIGFSIRTKVILLTLYFLPGIHQCLAICSEVIVIILDFVKTSHHAAISVKIIFVALVCKELAL